MKFLGTRIGHRSRMPYYPPRSFLAPGSGASLTASLSTRGDEPSTSGRNVTLDYHPLRGLGRGGRLLRPFSAAAAASSSSPAPAAASTGPAAVWREVLPTPVNVQDDQRALHTVSVALYANFTIFLAKLGVWLLSGSSSMLAEAVHSLVDVANQMFLRMGIQRAAKVRLMHFASPHPHRTLHSRVSGISIRFSSKILSPRPFSHVVTPTLLRSTASSHKHPRTAEAHLGPSLRLLQGQVRLLAHQCRRRAVPGGRDHLCPRHPSHYGPRRLHLLSIRGADGPGRELLRRGVFAAGRREGRGGRG